MSKLPTDNSSRKKLPVFDGLIQYFPLACLAVAEVSRVGNAQHNPGQPLHWAKEKSTDQRNTALRHWIDDAMGNERDTDGCWHLAKAAWRTLAELQIKMELAESEGKKLFTGKDIYVAADPVPLLPSDTTLRHHLNSSPTGKCWCGGDIVVGATSEIPNL